MKTAVVLATIICVGACSHATPAPEAAINPEPTAAPSPAQPALAPPAESIPQPVAAPTVTVPRNSIYFDFDKSDLKPPGEEFLSTLGDILAKYPDLRVRVEGNCDERGTEEYNIALGQRRADAAKDYLLHMGARRGQISTVSYGKDRPRAKGHDEESWRQNRRDDFIPSQSTLPAVPVSVNP